MKKLTAALFSVVLFASLAFTLVGNVNSGKLHKEGCEWKQKMSPANIV
jgi:hypothetical protein